MQTFIAKATKRNNLGINQARLAMARAYVRLVVVSGLHHDSVGHCWPTSLLPLAERESWPQPASVIGS